MISGQGNGLCWFKSCLSDRRQCIVYNGIANNHMRGPHGFILYPLHLFSIYILYNICSTLDHISYANDMILLSKWQILKNDRFYPHETE